MYPNLKGELLVQISSKCFAAKGRRRSLIQNSSPDTRCWEVRYSHPSASNPTLSAWYFISLSFYWHLFSRPKLMAAYRWHSSQQPDMALGEGFGEKPPPDVQVQVSWGAAPPFTFFISCLLNNTALPALKFWVRFFIFACLGGCITQDNHYSYKFYFSNFVLGWYL